MFQLKRFKYVFVALLLLCALFLFGGCYDLTEIENTLTVTAIGIDLSNNGETAVTFAYADITDKDKGSKAPLKCYTVNAKSITDASAKAEKTTSSHLSFTHIKCIAVNTDITDTLKNFADEMYLNLNINSSADIVFTVDGANEYLSFVNRICENTPDMYFENIFKSNKYLPSCTLADIYSSLMSDNAFISPLVQVTNNEPEYKAVICKDKKIYTLDNNSLLESYCILSGKLNKISVLYNNEYYDIYITSTPKVSVKQITDTEKSKIRILTTVQIRCENQSKEFVKTAKQNLCKTLNDYYAFEQKNEIDTLNMGQRLKSFYLTNDSIKKSDWYNMYKNAQIVTEVDV